MATTDSWRGTDGSWGSTFCSNEKKKYLSAEKRPVSVNVSGLFCIAHPRCVAVPYATASPLGLCFRGSTRGQSMHEYLTDPRDGFELLQKLSFRGKL